MTIEDMINGLAELGMEPEEAAQVPILIMGKTGPEPASAVFANIDGRLSLIVLTLEQARSALGFMTREPS